MAYIRPYQASDEDAIIHIFRETASPDLVAAGDPALHYASYNWARPYIMLVPSTCFVIDDGNGTAVGYILGVSDTYKFVEEYKAKYLPALAAQGLSEPSPADDGVSGNDLPLAMQRFTWHPESMLVDKNPNLLKQYPAHLHIDILADYQKKGFGRELVQAMIGQFRKMGVSGMHLGKVGTNFGAGEFYAKLGFQRFDEVMDGGRSGETGRVEDGGIYLVKKL